MRGKTHLYAGIMVGCGYCAVAQPTAEQAAMTLAVAGAAALLPDLDTPTSTLGRKVPVLSFLARLTTGHRGILHSAIPWAAVWYLVYRYVPTLSPYAFVGAIGTVSHLLLDALNPMGVPILAPLPGKLRLARIRSGGTGDKLLSLALRVIAVAAAAYTLFGWTMGTTPLQSFDTILAALAGWRG